MTEITPEQQAAIEAQLNNPEFVKAYQQTIANAPRGKMGGKLTQGVLAPLYQKFGIQLPKDYEPSMDKSGKIGLSKVGFYDRNSDWIPGAIIGGAFGGSGLIGGFGAPGVAGSVAPGIGETGATTGLAGSGFAGEAGGLGASTVLPSGASAAIPTTGVSVAGSHGVGSVISKILGKSNVLGDAGDIGNSIANDEARNRTQRGNWAQDYDRIRLQGNQDNRTMESDALKKAAQTSYIMGGGASFNPSTIQLNSGRMPDLGLGPKPSTDFEKQAASTLQSQLLSRLSPEGHFTPTPLDSYAKAGTVENIGKGINYGTSIANVGKSIWDIFK